MVGAVQVHLRKLSKSVLILLYIKVPNLLSMADFFILRYSVCSNYMLIHAVSKCANMCVLPW